MSEAPNSRLGQFVKIPRLGRQGEARRGKASHDKWTSGSNTNKQLGRDPRVHAARGAFISQLPLPIFKHLHLVYVFLSVFCYTCTAHATTRFGSCANITRRASVLIPPIIIAAVDYHYYTKHISSGMWPIVGSTTKPVPTNPWWDQMRARVQSSF